MATKITANVETVSAEIAKLSWTLHPVEIEGHTLVTSGGLDEQHWYTQRKINFLEKLGATDIEVQEVDFVPDPNI